VGAGNNSAYSLFFYTDNKLSIDIDGSGDRFSTNTIFTTEQWYHLAVVYDGTRMSSERVTVYIDGAIDRIAPESSASIPNYNSDLYLGIMNAGYAQKYAGRIDEVRIWNDVRTAQEIRESMHLTLDGTESGLVSYWQFNDGSGSTAWDAVGGNSGTLNNMTNDDWVSSTIPTGSGTSNSQPVSSTGNVIFTGTNLSMDFTAKSGTDDFTVTKITRSPNTTPSGLNGVFDDQYWVIDKFGSGTFTADLTFEVNEDLSPDDEGNPNRIELYIRDSNADGSWTLEASAVSVDAANNIATFPNISTLSQFLLARNIPPENSPGTALDFDGTNDYVEVADDDALDLTSNYTIEAWIKIDSFGWVAGIISKYQTSGSKGYYLCLSPYSPSTGFRFDQTETAIGILEANQWYHVAAVNDNGTRRLYLNGVSQALSGTPLTVQSNTDPLRIGVDFSSREFDGRIDEVRLWNDVRTRQEIRESMHLTLDGTESGLVCYWQFNDGSGTTAADVAGGHDGTLNNMTNADWVSSTVPTGGGASNSQVVSSTGNVSFTGTNLSMNFTAQSGTNKFTVTKITRAPNITPTNMDEVFDNQYWAVNKYGSGTFTADLTFEVNEDLSAEDESAPNRIGLFTRDSNADGSWTRIATASNVDAATNTATFPNINTLSQFLLARNQPPDSLPGTALDFDGTDDYVAINTVLPDVGSIELWFYPESFYDYNTIFDNSGDQNDWEMWIYVNGKLRFRVDDGEIKYDLNNLQGAGHWYHLAVTWQKHDTNLVDYELYVNGVSRGSATNTNWVNPGDTFYLAGGHSSNSAGDGKYDELRLWNDIRTVQEIRENMHLTLNGNESGLGGYWQFNEGSGGTAGDVVSGNNGTLNNMTNDNWVDSTIPVGGGTCNSQNGVKEQSVTLGNVVIDDTSDAFDNAVDISCAEISRAPNTLPSPGGNNHVLNDRYWVVDAFGTPGTFSAEITFTLPSGYLDTGDAANLILYKRDSTSDGDWTASVTGASNVTETTVKFDGITSFSQFTIGSSGDSSLPVELSSFTATSDCGKVILNWITKTEVNNVGFSLYRSDTEYGEYSKVAWLEGAGNTPFGTDYEYVDSSSQSGRTYYYYLEDVDIQGVRTKSDIIKIQRNDKDCKCRRVLWVDGKIVKDYSKDYRYLDKSVNPGIYYYYLNITANGVVSKSDIIKVEVIQIPTEYRLLQNFPNPFNPDTWLPYELPESVPVVIEIYNIKGHLVRQLNLGPKEAGYYVTRDKAARWDGRNDCGEQIASGVYFYRLRAGKFNAIRQMVILK